MFLMEESRERKKLQVKRFLLRIDQFGLNINLTYKGSQKYTTVTGGICTVMLFTALLILTLKVVG